MPPTPSTMRVGEQITLVAHPKDADREDYELDPVEVNWTPNVGAPSAIVTVTPDGVTNLTATVQADAIGSEIVEVEGNDFDNIAATQPITVLDASALTFAVIDPVNCSLKWVGAKLYVIPNPTGTPTFTLQVFARDSRTDRPFPVYALSDGPNLSTDTQKLTFGLGGDPTSSDDDEVYVNAVDGGDEVIHAEATTDATATPITGTLEVRIVALTTMGPLTYT